MAKLRVLASPIQPCFVVFNIPMKGKPKKTGREKDLTRRFMSGRLDEDRVDSQQRFGERSRQFQHRKMQRTAVLRAAAEEETPTDLESLPVGQAIQVHSLFIEVECGGEILLCVVRKTMAKLERGWVVVGDRVRFRPTGMTDEQGRPEAVIEQILPRTTLLTRSDSFKAMEAQPIVANADQVLIVAALAQPRPKWGLIDRMLVAAEAGGLTPIVCLNKLDLIDDSDGRREWEFAEGALAHYESIGVTVVQTSVSLGRGLDSLSKMLREKTTVLAGHSGVGKSSLITAVQPSIDIRVGEISRYTGKGRHTTTSARRYLLEGGGYVIDTPGVKMFGLWNVSRENLVEFFPDVAADTAPQWRVESFARILESLS